MEYLNRIDVTGASPNNYGRSNRCETSEELLESLCFRPEQTVFGLILAEDDDNDGL